MVMREVNEQALQELKRLKATGLHPEVLANIRQWLYQTDAALDKASNKVTSAAVFVEIQYDRLRLDLMRTKFFPEAGAD